MKVTDEIKRMNKFNQYLTDYTQELKARAGSKMLKEFSELRGFSMDIIDKSDIFYIGDAIEMLIPSYLNRVESFGVISPTNKKPIFHDRYVIPIKNSHGQVINLVGYKKDADERYVYGTALYYRRRDTLYGLENMSKAYRDGYAIITEGITDTIRVRDIGFDNAFAMCGTHKSEFIIKQLNRCKHGILKIPDRDFAGKRAVAGWKCNRGITLNIFVKYKDIDELCRESNDNIEWVKDYIEDCISWLKTGEHRGYIAQSEVITMG